MSYKTTISKNLGGTAGITVDGDFIESNIEAGKSAVVVEGGGVSYPANKRKVMSKPFMLKKTPLGAIAEEPSVWLTLPYAYFDDTQTSTIVAKIYPEAAIALNEVDIIGDDPTTQISTKQLIRDINFSSSLFMQRIIIISKYIDDDTEEDVFGLKIYYPLVDTEQHEYCLYRTQLPEKICVIPAGAGSVTTTYSSFVNFGTSTNPNNIPINIYLNYQRTETETGSGTLHYTWEYITTLEWEITLNTSIVANGSYSYTDSGIEHNDQPSNGCYLPPYPQRRTGYDTQNLITSFVGTLFPRSLSVCLLATPYVILYEKLSYSKQYNHRTDWGHPCEENIDPATDCVGYYHDTVSDSIDVTHELILVTTSNQYTVKNVSYSDAKSYIYTSDNCAVPCPGDSVSHDLCASHGFTGDCAVYNYPEETEIPSVLLLFDEVVLQRDRHLIAVITHTYNKPNLDYWQPLVASNMSADSSAVFIGFLNTETGEINEATDTLIPNIGTLKAEIKNMINRTRSNNSLYSQLHKVYAIGACPNTCDCDNMASCPTTFTYCTMLQESNIITSNVICLGYLKAVNYNGNLYLYSYYEFAPQFSGFSKHSDMHNAYAPSQLYLFTRAPSYAHQEVATLFDPNRVAEYDGRPWFNPSKNLTNIIEAFENADPISF